MQWHSKSPHTYTNTAYISLNRWIYMLAACSCMKLWVGICTGLHFAFCWSLQFTLFWVGTTFLSKTQFSLFVKVHLCFSYNYFYLSFFRSIFLSNLSFYLSFWPCLFCLFVCLFPSFLPPSLPPFLYFLTTQNYCSTPMFLTKI